MRLKDTELDLNELNKQWHQGFYSAARLELNADKDNLFFEEEYYLSHEPIRIDLLMIKKLDNTPIQNEIGHIFRKYNICEYKSPEDGLTIDDYYKTIGYACLYKGLADRVNAIPADEITVTLVREGYPAKLIGQLSDYGLKITEYSPGICYVTGNTLFPIQIVVSSRLGKGHHWLKVLTNKISEEEILDFTVASHSMVEQGQRNYVDSIYQISVMANMKAYDDTKRRWPELCESLRILMKPEIEADLAAARERGLQEGRQVGMQQGMQQTLQLICRLKEGAQPSSLIEDGYSIDIINMALEALKS